MKKIRIGIVGAGMAWEKLHGPAYARLQDKFEIAAICDSDINKAVSAANYIGLDSSRAFCDNNKMFELEDLEAVDIMVPIEANHETAKAAIQNGLQVFAEKPFSSTSSAAEDLIALKDRKGVKVLVGENFRYTEENRIIKRLINENAIGDTVYFIDNEVKDFKEEMLGDSFSAKEWRQHPKFNGGIFLDSGIHHIARLRYFFGPCTGISACGRPSDTDFCPYSCINSLLMFQNGVSGVYSFFCVGKETQSPLVGLRIFGTEGEIYLEDKDCGFINVSHKDGRHEVIQYRPEEGYVQELENFYEALRNGAEIVSTPEKELGDIKVIESILKSCAN